MGFEFEEEEAGLLCGHTSDGFSSTVEESLVHMKEKNVSDHNNRLAEIPKVPWSWPARKQALHVRKERSTPLGKPFARRRQGRSQILRERTSQD